MNKAMRRLPIFLVALLFLLGCTGLFGCAHLKHREYKPFVRDLDGKSELEISTFPAWYPEKGKHIPRLYKERVTSEKLNFQVFIRDRKSKIGPNPHVKTIAIHSFSYRLDGGPKVELLTDFPSNFWMQENVNYDKESASQVMYDSESVVGIDIDFTLNGNAYTFNGEMPAHEYSTYTALLLEYFVKGHHTD